MSELPKNSWKSFVHIPLDLSISRPGEGIKKWVSCKNIIFLKIFRLYPIRVENFASRPGEGGKKLANCKKSWKFFVSISSTWKFCIQERDKKGVNCKKILEILHPYPSLEHEKMDVSLGFLTHFEVACGTKKVGQHCSITFPPDIPT